jgi:hypothetical protein
VVQRGNDTMQLLTTDSKEIIVWINHVKMYQVTLQMIEREMANSATPLVLENIKREIRKIWSQSQSNTGNVYE